MSTECGPEADGTDVLKFPRGQSVSALRRVPRARLIIRKGEFMNMRKPLYLAVFTILAGLLSSSPVIAEKGGAGEKFKLFGVASDSFDPENATNGAVLFNVVTATDFAGIQRKINKGNKVSDLTNQVQVKYYMD